MGVAAGIEDEQPVVHQAASCLNIDERPFPPGHTAASSSNIDARAADAPTDIYEEAAGVMEVLPASSLNIDAHAPTTIAAEHDATVSDRNGLAASSLNIDASSSGSRRVIFEH